MRSTLLRTLVVVSCAPVAVAQWSSNSNLNLAIGDLTGDQAVSKIAATADGGCYIGWFDNHGTGYEVRLQRLDRDGVEQWAHNGIVVSNNPQNSSLIGWELIADSAGNCVLTFTDLRSGPDLDVYAYRIDPTGAQLWGANGVAVSANADADGNPSVCETTAGLFAVAWTNSTTPSVHVQMLTPVGAPLFPPDGVVIPPDAGVTPAFVHVVPSDNGSVILAWVRGLAFSAAKHIHAQKVDITGAQLWGGGTRIPIFDSNSLPIAHDPKLIADGVGGAVCSWHFAVGVAFSARVQHIDSNGVELFLHNGVDVSVANGNSKFDPSIAIDVASQTIGVVWNERNSGQTTWGILAQKIDLLGTRLWGAGGVTLLPIDTVNKLAPVCVPWQGGVMAFVLEATGSVTKRLRGMRADAAGNVVWPTPVDLCTVSSDKLRIAAAVSPSGASMVCWSDARSLNGNDVIAQNIGSNGVLAPAMAQVLATGCGGNPAGSFTVSGRPAFAHTMTVGIDNPLGTQAPGSIAILAYSFTAVPGFPCGVPVPGFGMAAAGANGEILIGTIDFFVGPSWAGPGQPAIMQVGIPPLDGLYGVPVYLQGALLDPSPFAAIPIGVTTGTRWTIGY